jgi:hypothetical protein
LEAVKVVDVASTEQLNWPVTAVAPVSVMFSGEGVQVTPGGAVEAETATRPVNPPLGVTETVVLWLAPVADDNVRLAGV